MMMMGISTSLLYLSSARIKQIQRFIRFLSYCVCEINLAATIREEEQRNLAGCEEDKSVGWHGSCLGSSEASLKRGTDNCLPHDLHWRQLQSELRFLPPSKREFIEQGFAVKGGLAGFRF
jgi:hypothetical protein